MKCPPPIPILCAFIIPLHKPVAIATSTTLPFFSKICFPTVEQYELSHAIEYLVYVPKKL
jgi:hypothetical protein